MSSDIQQKIVGLYSLSSGRRETVRKILQITTTPDKLEKICETIFPNSTVYDRYHHVDQLNALIAKRRIFDILIVTDLIDQQLDLLLNKVKFQHIIVIGCNIDSMGPYNYQKSSFNNEDCLLENLDVIYDMFMPIGPADYNIASASIANKRDKLDGLREIFYCASHDLNVDAVFVEEDRYPFSLYDLQKMINSSSNRIGWYHQQLKQIYASLTFESMMSRAVSICCDVFFNKSMPFFRGDKPIFTFGRERPHSPYFQHMARLHPSLKCYTGRSAISHHSVFEKQYISKMIDFVEEFHQKSFFKVFMESIDRTHLEYSGAAEYEIYFNFLAYYKREFIVRESNYLDTGNFNEGLASDYTYFAYHWYMRN